mgnify:CR=1 FL=1
MIGEKRIRESGNISKDGVDQEQIMQINSLPLHFAIIYSRILCMNMIAIISMKL